MPYKFVKKINQWNDSLAVVLTKAKNFSCFQPATVQLCQNKSSGPEFLYLKGASRLNAVQLVFKSAVENNFLTHSVCF